VAKSGAVSGSQSALREANRALILETIKHFGGLTQVEMADATGLSQATVSIIVQELVQSGTVSTTATSRNGRRATFVTLSRELGLVAGAHVGRRELSVALSDLSGEIVAEHTLKLASEHRADTTLDQTGMLITEMLESIGADHGELRQIGLAVSAPIDQLTGKIASPGIMRGWDDVELADALYSRTLVPVAVDNASNLAAMAEYRLGAGAGADVLIYLDVGQGIGSGIVINGAVFHGHTGTAGEIGHMTVDENGPICYCGNRGCLEMIAGARAMTEPLRITHGNLSQRDLIALALDGDAGAARAVADAAGHIGLALAQMCTLFDPRKVVVGGPLSQTGEIFLSPLRLATARHTLPSTGPSIEILPTALGSRADVTGAVLLALDTVRLATPSHIIRPKEEILQKEAS
jgi:predicted NBD/HSP70 family sugar kinase